VKTPGFGRWFAAALLVACSAADAGAVGRSLCNGAPNGILDGQEECETGPCCTVRCELASATTLCRAAGADPACDAAELCGERAPVANAACPADVKADEGTPCNDGQFCTSDEVCTGGACDGTATSTCDDDNSCTTDACNENKNKCSNQPLADGEDCDDRNACTNGDQCAGGQCVSGPSVVCDDNNDCTDDACQSGPGCVFTNNTDACDDGKFCTDDDACAGGVCAGGGDHDCDDGNVCTDDQCNEAENGCDNVDNTAGCDDGKFCTGNDACSGGSCAGSPVDCGDGNACTDDVCNEAEERCDHPNNSLPCSDGQFCTVGDACSGGTCTSGGARNCSDGNACTDDVCNEGGGACDHNDNTDGCDDGQFCTVGDACSAGACTGSNRVCDDGLLCTSDACNEDSDQCDFLANSLACSDGVFCNGADTCDDGSCSLHAGDPCGGPDDDNDCNESCDEQPDTCTAADPDLSPCSDGNICTVGDACDDGVCVSGEGENPICVTTTTETPTTTVEVTTTTLAVTTTTVEVPTTTLEVTTTTMTVTTTTAEVPTTTLQVPTTTLPGEVLCGDFNGDRELTAADALGALRASVGAVECALAVCDFTGDGDVTSTDALAILRASVGLSADPNCPPVVA